MKITKKELLKNVLLEKNVTFLLGAGASAPFFSSLGRLELILSHKDISQEGANLIKTLFFKLSISDNSYLLNYLNNHCYCGEKSELMVKILNEYLRFIYNNLEYLKLRNSRVSPKRVNLVTTNYDLFLESAVETVLENNPRIFFNDGANGYVKRVLNTDNFNKTLLYSGIFDNYSNEMSVINMIKCHGSINWKRVQQKKDKKQMVQITPSESAITKINVLLKDFLIKFEEDVDNYSILANLSFSDSNDFIRLLNSKEIDMDKLVSDINKLAIHSKGMTSEIRKNLEQLQIVFPTKRKFQSTLIEEHYFNMLRLLSYELEKEQSALIVFGFSFYDEHISDVVQRSLNNPNLIVLIFCFQNDDAADIISRFNFSDFTIPKNIIFIKPDDFLKRTYTNEEFETQEKELDLSNYTVIKADSEVKLYSSEVHSIDINSNTIPVLDFYSLNSCMEEELSNKYLPIMLETGDIYE
ncbi:hypothetical protein BOQ37_07480 [Listeria monocytogenes]|nr:hypothetical protein [Listeria monocytogenes]EKF1880206.1 SIR2 family protein [Listeria innocua]HBN5101183.1 SIR2 family protein [Listeria innocua]HBN5104074.1 SIR2 family protein [Listeria innocua]HCJ1282241.1 SIR2 family protein [Listeria innocua]